MKLLKQPLYKFQKEASSQALKLNEFALLMEQGTGKTITALKVVAVRWRREHIHRVLVVGPKNVLGSWRRQIERHLNVPCDVSVGVRGLHDVLHTRRPISGRLQFLIINYEQVWRNLDKLLFFGWDFIIADESHRMRNRSSKQSKAMADLAINIRYKLMLTGTPVGKDEIDLYAQARFLKYHLFGSWTDFKKRYLRIVKIKNSLDKVVFSKLKFKPKKRDRMLEKLAPYVYRITAKQALPHLPPTSDEIIEFDLSPQVRKAYDTLERDFYVKFKDFETTTPLTIINMLRLQQLAGGHIKSDDGDLIRLKQDKLLHFADWVSDLPQDEKLVVFCKFTHEVDLIAEVMKKLKRTYAIRDGRTKPEDLDLWMKFQDEQNPNTYIAQIKSGGIGIDLFASRLGVFYSNSFSSIDYDQARKRLDRNGQTRPVLFIHMVAKNTIDECIYDSLNEDRLNADAILRFIQQKHEKRK